MRTTARGSRHWSQKCVANPGTVVPLAQLNAGQGTAKGLTLMWVLILKPMKVARQCDELPRFPVWQSPDSPTAVHGCLRQQPRQ
jgi:hypothetical protein